MTATLRLPSDERADEEYLYERYREGQPGSARRRQLARGYYRVKPLLPRRLQVAMRRSAARRQARTEFPEWPLEDVLLRRRGAAVAQASAEPDGLPALAPWPDGKRFAWVLTHDVESAEGLARADELLEVERRHAARSSWNLCTRWYEVDDRDVAEFERHGAEVGLHGLYHDDRHFRDRATFESLLPQIAEEMERLGAVGFRAPALHRNADWMHELPARYDSSFPHSDPFQPVAGGCCSIFPFFFGPVVELPVTVDQDFTVFELLRDRDIGRWVSKSRWIAAHSGLVNVIIHPDYMTPERLALVEEFIAHLQGLDGGWHALPHEVADWWRLRDELRLVGEGAEVPAIVGPGADRAHVCRATAADGLLRFAY